MKKISTEKLDEFIKLAETDKVSEEAVASIGTKTEEVKELIKDIPENEIQDFLNDTEALTSETEEISLN
jgi:hypothetical protein